MHRKSLRPRTIHAVLLGALLLACWPLKGRAQQPGDPAAGHRLSDTWCGSCHLVGPDVTSAVSNGVPTFFGIAQNKETTVLSLRVFLQTPHAGMPDLHLTREEVNNLAAYILSLRTH